MDSGGSIGQIAYTLMVWATGLGLIVFALFPLVLPILGLTIVVLLVLALPLILLGVPAAILAGLWIGMRAMTRSRRERRG